MFPLALPFKRRVVDLYQLPRVQPGSAAEFHGGGSNASTGLGRSGRRTRGSVPRLALTAMEAPAALGVSDDFSAITSLGSCAGFGAGRRSSSASVSSRRGSSVRLDGRWTVTAPGDRLSLTNRGQGSFANVHAGARQVCARAQVPVIVPEPAERQRRTISAENRDAFLAALKQGFSITHAARLAGHARQRMYELRGADEEFAAAWADAWEQGTDVLEDELRRRALGYDEVTYDGDGRVLRCVHRFDTPAIVLALKARRPGLYRDNLARVELTGRAGGPLQNRG